MNPGRLVRRTTAGAEKWEPCITSHGRTLGEAGWLRRRTGGASSPRAMLWRCDPMSFDYGFPGDEIVELRTGGAASFPRGTPSVWTIVERVEKFTVVSG